MSFELHDVPAHCDVGKRIAKFLVDKNIVKMGAFADLADSKAGIVEVVGRPAGLDPSYGMACQPLKSAWRKAEADTKAKLDARAKG